MHRQTFEETIVADFLAALLARLALESVQKVRRIRIRRGAGMPEPALRRILDTRIVGTPLQGSELVIEDHTFEHTCKQCGLSQIVSADELFGELFICPQCGWSHEIERVIRLELIEFTPQTVVHKGNTH